MPPKLRGRSQKELELLAEGHRANARADYAAARLNFLAACELFGDRVEAQLSAANMAAKMGDDELAASEYREMLARADLSHWHRGRISLKLQQATTATTASAAEKKI